MRKFFLLTAALLAGGLLFSGCIALDAYDMSIRTDQVFGCYDQCGENDPSQVVYDFATGIHGPDWFIYPEEQGAYTWVGQYMDPTKEETTTEGPPPCLWEGAGATGNHLRIDTYRNWADALATGCPISYYCQWRSGPTWRIPSIGPDWGFWLRLCEQDILNETEDPYCNRGNGQCTGPYNYAYYGYTIGPNVQSPPDTYFEELYYISIDLQPGTTFELWDNVRRLPGDLCPDCGAGASALQAPPGKTVVCHVPPGNPGNAHTIVVGNAAVPAHLAHGDYLGDCAGGVSGEGLEVPAGNNAPQYYFSWVLNIDWWYYPLDSGLPWTDDYHSYEGGSLTPQQAALLDVLESRPDFKAGDANNPGGATLEIRRLLGVEDVTLDPPLKWTMIIDYNDEGGWYSQDVIDISTPSAVQFLQWQVNNMRENSLEDFAGMALELTDGTVVPGNVLQGRYPRGMVPYIGDHDRLYQAINALQSHNGRDLDPRVALR